ncbi:MAG: flavin reductase family protein [Propionibacteriaceae bacterium]
MSTDERTLPPGGTDEGGPDWVTAQAFKSVFRRHPAGVAVITLAVGERLVGLTATSVISVSADPPILAFSIDSGSSSWPALAVAETVVINFLAASQVDLSARFATKDIDRFADGGWSLLPTGEPVIDGSAAWLRGEIIQRTPVGRSFLISVLALESHQAEPVVPLVYHDRTYHGVGDHSAI